MVVLRLKYNEKYMFKVGVWSFRGHGYGNHDLRIYVPYWMFQQNLLLPSSA